MGRKIWILLITCVLLITFVGPVWAASEEDFWITWRQGDYYKAGDLAKELGLTIPEYYSLAAICYQNSYQYDLFRIYKNKFRQLATPDGLRELLAKEQSANPEDPQVLFLQGITTILFPEAKIGDPSILLEKAAVKLKDNPYLNNYLALVEINSHNYSLTVQKYLQKSIALKKDYPEPYINLAMVLVQSKEIDKAISVLLDCFNNCPLAPVNAYENLINLVNVPVTVTIKPYGQQMAVFAPSIKEIYRQKIKTGLSKTPAHLLALAEQFAIKGNTALARDLLSGIDFNGYGLYNYIQLQMAHLDGTFGQVTSNGEEFVRILLNVKDLNYQRLYEAGNIFFYSKEFKSAIAFYGAALKVINQDDNEYLVKINTNLGICSYLNQDYPNALIYLEKVLTYNPKDPSSYVYLGLTYRDMGDKTKALEYLTKALEYIYDKDWRQDVTGIIDELNPMEIRR